jgi:nitrite reductase/ring-hydroxylating ferredoxin subunit
VGDAPNDATAAPTHAPATWQRLTTADDVPPGSMKAVVLAGVTILLVNTGGDMVAYDDRCPHAGNPLSLGWLDGDLLVCAAHGWTFDARRGDGVSPVSACLRRYPLRVDDDGGVAVRVTTT